jgi:hypothetical protein
MRFCAIVSLALLAATSMAPVAAHATCGAEGCPLVRRDLGEEGSRFAFDLRYQDVQQDVPWMGSHEATLSDIVANAEAHGEVELFTRTRSWVAEGRARLGDRFHVVAMLPYVDREHRHMLRHTPVYNPLFVTTWKFKGVGDATVLGQFTPLRRQGRWGASLQAGVKLPTGRRHVPDEAQDNFGFESTLEPSARPGTGSTDWLIGGQASYATPWHRMVPVTVSVLGRFNGKGTDDYQVGNELQAGLSSGWAPVDRVALLGQVNFSAHGSDVSAEATEAAHTGMKSLFLTPGVSVRLAPGLSLYALYQVRVLGRSDEATVIARDHLLVGTSYALGR